MVRFMGIPKRQIVSNIERNERLGLFDQPTQPVNPNLVAELKDDYVYLRHNIFYKLGTYMAHGVVRIAGDCFSGIAHLRVVGKQNLKNINSAIITCNHIHDLDCTYIAHSVRHRRIFYTVSENNNKKGIAGFFLRQGGILPLGGSLTNTKNLSRAISELLDKGSFVVFYPEAELWWNYKKPRPLKRGAYYYATKNNVPILPMFITFAPRKKPRRDGLPKYNLTMHILPPIYPDPKKSKAENAEILRYTNFALWRDKYEEVYGQKLEYTTQNEEVKQELKKYLDYKI